MVTASKMSKYGVFSGPYFRISNLDSKVPSSEKKHQYKPKILWFRDKTQPIYLQISGNQNISFFKKNSMV